MAILTGGNREIQCRFKETGDSCSFSASRLSRSSLMHAVKSQEKPLGPGYRDSGIPETEICKENKSVMHLSSSY